MNDVNLHSFIGKCSLEVLDVLFPVSSKRRITAQEIRDVCCFEESSGHEDTIVLFYQYLSQLEKYETGTVHIVIAVYCSCSVIKIGWHR